MRLFKDFEEVGKVRQKIFDIPEFVDAIPERRTALSGFRVHVGRAVRLLLQEPEIAVFALAQWVVVILVYALWSWGRRQIDLPDQLEELAFFAWSLACVALVALPVGFFTACIAMVHFLRQEGEESTLLACMRRVAPRMGPLWTFTFIDVGITAGQWLDRLPSRRERSDKERAVSEALYYAWKVATVGILPGILADRTLLKATYESVDLVKKHLAAALLLRSGYTLATWLVGLSAFGISWWQLREHRELLPDIAGAGFWFWAPAVIALGLVHLVLRPIFLLASCELYHEYRRQPAGGKGAAHPAGPPRQRTDARLAAAMPLTAVTALVIAIWAIFFYDLFGPARKREPAPPVPVSPRTASPVVPSPVAPVRH